MPRVELTVHRDVAAPRRVVWSVLTDIERWPRWISQIRKIEPRTTGPYAVGTRWQETRVVRGEKVVQELCVIEAQEPQRTVIVSALDGLDYRLTYELRKLPSGRTRATVRLRAKTDEDAGPEGGYLRSLGRSERDRAESALKHELDALAQESKRRRG